MPFARRLVICIAALLIPLISKAANPPLGIPISNEIRSELQNGFEALERMIERLENEAINFPFMKALLPHVAIYYNAVRYALIHDQFYQDWKPDEFEVAAMSLTTPGLILPGQRKIAGTR
jgi:hypothetical protein